MHHVTKKIKATIYLKIHLLDKTDSHVLNEAYLMLEPVFTLHDIPSDLPEEDLFDQISNQQINKRMSAIMGDQKLLQTLRRRYPMLPAFTVQIVDFAHEKIYFEDVTQ